MNKLPLSELHSLRYMTEPEALSYLERFNLTSDELSEIRPLIGRSLVAPLPEDVQHNPVAVEAMTVRTSTANLPRRYMMCTLWILGGSYRSIGKMFNVSPQTVAAHVDRTLPRGEARHKIRYNVAATHSGLEYYHKAWLKHAAELGGLSTPEDMAEWLVNHVPEKDDG